jgi:hypothetical protein
MSNGLITDPSLPVSRRQFLRLAGRRHTEVERAPDASSSFRVLLPTSENRWISCSDSVLDADQK